MHAIIVSEFGGPEVLRHVDAPSPTPGPHQYMVSVRTIGVNYADVWMRQGRYPNPTPPPFVPGWEVVGSVNGRRVAVPMFASGALIGGYADSVIAGADSLVPVPDEVTDEAAAALLMQGTTAHFLLEHTPVRGRRVLISAAAGGVGTLLVQLAKLGGAAQIIALASSGEKLSLVLELGADVAVDYGQPDWCERVRAATDGTGADLVLDSVGGAVARSVIEFLAPRGTYAVYGAASMNITTLDAGQVQRMGVTNQSFTSFSLAPALADPPRWRKALETLFTQVRSGALRTITGSRWPLAEAAAAHRALESRMTIGKVTLQP